MTTRTTNALSFFEKSLQTTFQVGMLIGLWWLCQLATQSFRVEIPGGVLGLLVLVILLLSGWMPVKWISRGAGFLLDHLLLFFVPAAMTLLNHPEFLGWIGVKILVVVVFGITLVMIGTSMAVEWHLLMRSRHAR
ncbi:CidA/LrgA family protein [Desulfovibrio gilichinskyi]|uniref:Holin-like protein n=1 Tax=Desulfovibrio gilichinskyi TaxID=1519643 RepID=A0A1X7ETD5_9BACT|nr:CidA/LrgA family protein [Desulfovibrio gilichinskyi]SMF39219.1 holin-like protein [Desulfovibrio gilichinskyi]